MAPPHTSRISKPAVQQTTSRQRPRESRKHVVKGSGKEVYNSSQTASNEEGEIDESQPQSQNASDDALEQLVVEMVDAQRKRHQIRKSDVYKAYKTSYDESKNAISTLFDNHEAKAAKAFDAHILRLQALLKEKSRLEAEMTKKLANVRAQYSSHSKDFQSVLEHRRRELR